MVAWFTAAAVLACIDVGIAAATTGRHGGGCVHVECGGVPVSSVQSRVCTCRQVGWCFWHQRAQERGGCHGADAPLE
jgi:hypothetical protein